ncbi:MAG: CvpA family protein [Bacteroidales bacterium]
MNYIDMFILVLLVYAAFKGFTKGFIMQLTLLIALGVGIFMALKLSGITARFLEDRLAIRPESLYLVSVGITFLLVFIGINLVGRLIDKAVKSVDLSFINRMLGVLFSVCKTVIILGALLTFVDRIDRQVRFLPENTREHSIFYKPFTQVIRVLFPSFGSPNEDPSENSEFARFRRGDIMEAK